jgi:hypothetical protein
MFLAMAFRLAVDLIGILGCAVAGLPLELVTAARGGELVPLAAPSLVAGLADCWK